MSKIADGPWRASLKTKKTNNIGIYNRSGELVATIDVHQCAGLEARRRKWSEACAMAAAPELLEALQRALNVLQATGAQAEASAALDAIARATEEA